VLLGLSLPQTWSQKGQTQVLLLLVLLLLQGLQAWALERKDQTPQVGQELTQPLITEEVQACSQGQQQAQRQKLVWVSLQHSWAWLLQKRGLNLHC